MTLIFIIFTNHPRITAEVLNLVVSHTFSFKGTPILRRWSNDQGVIHGPWTNGLRSNDLQLRSRQDEFGVSTAAGYHVRRTARLRVDWERLRLSWRGPNTSRSGEMGIWSVATYSFTMPWYHGLPVGGGQKLLNIGAFPNVIYPRHLTPKFIYESNSKPWFRKGCIWWISYCSRWGLLSPTPFDLKLRLMGDFMVPVN